MDDDVWSQIATAVADDPDEMYGVLARLRCLLHLTSTSRTLHNKVGQRPFTLLGLRYGLSNEVEAARRGVPRAADIALVRDAALTADMRANFGVFVDDDDDPDSRRAVLEVAARLLVSPPVAAHAPPPRVGVLLRLVVRRQARASVTCRDALSRYCLRPHDIACIPRSFAAPAFSCSRGRSTTIVGLSMHHVLHAALLRHGSTEAMHRTAATLARDRDAATLRREQAELDEDELASSVGFFFLVPAADVVGQPGREGPAMAMWTHLTRRVAGRQWAGDRLAPPKRAKAIVRAFVRDRARERMDREAGLISEAVGLCEQALARSALCVPPV